MVGEYRCLSADDLAHAIPEDGAHVQSEACRAMKLRRTAALALVGWNPMMPPLHHNNWDTKAPFSQWTKIKTFTNEKECRMHTIGAMQEYGYNILRESAAQSGANVHF